MHPDEETAAEGGKMPAAEAPQAAPQPTEAAPDPAAAPPWAEDSSDGVAAQAGTSETDADPADPNVRPVGVGGAAPVPDVDDPHGNEAA
jgi:hypothetical protein